MLNIAIVIVIVIVIVIAIVVVIVIAIVVVIVIGVVVIVIVIMALSSTRSQDKVYPEYGIDYSLEEFLGAQVPSNRDVLRHFFYFREQGLPHYECIGKTSTNILERWRGSNVKLVQPKYIGRKIEDLYSQIQYVYYIACTCV